VRPDLLVPVHGGRHQLERLAELGRALGVGEVVVRENGQPLLFRAAGPIELGPAFDAAPVPIGAGRTLDDRVLSERRKLGRGGAILLSAAIGPQGGWQIEARAVGLALSDDEQRVVVHACLACLGTDQAGTAPAALERRLRHSALAALRRMGRGRPVIVVSIVRSG
jgi:mRNA degradation ribonuclease J1/J2